ncbi:hypothetical protein GCM10008939_13110 [Deinococcus aquiradiocola]|uniref:Tyr recombinase domain-containing protein n=1 Tax=Deinococcus aquiradiocola TaxID=393059 RepID=A0A917UN34_9DEIO|nr:hypothetical protein GCM10008939_13110 [Deinococcus aquiradiocola]
MVVPDRDSVYQRALTQLQQLPEQDEAQQLRVALDRFDTEGAWTLMSPRFKAAPGSHSHKNYFSAFRDLLAWAQAEGYALTEPAPQFGADYKLHLEQRYAQSAASINTRLSQARKFYRIFRQVGVIPSNLDPFSLLERARVTPGEHRHYYTDEEVSRLLAQADLPERVMLLLGAHSGLTTAEVLALRWTHVSFTDGTLTLPDRTVPISMDLERVLRPHAEQVGGGALFSTPTPVVDFPDQNQLRARVFTLCLKANVTYQAWRGLRHAAGRRYYRQLRSIEQVAARLGVENPHLVRMYAEEQSG